MLLAVTSVPGRARIARQLSRLFTAALFSGSAACSNSPGASGMAGAFAAAGTSTSGNNTGGAAGGANTTGGQGVAGGPNAVAGAPAGGGEAPAGGQAGGTSPGGAPAGGVGSLPPFILGADVTITMEDEYWGANYTDAGTQKPLEVLLKDHGFNFIRIDTFVNPGAPGGFAAEMEQPFRDLAHTITLAKRVKAAGMGFLLDLHYSDTWTNPWSTSNASGLERSCGRAARDESLRLHQRRGEPVEGGRGAPRHRTDWQRDHERHVVGHRQSVGQQLRQLCHLAQGGGIRAVHDVDPTIQIMLHIEKCNDTETSEWWLDGVLGAGVVFDILGQSCYATAPNGVTGYQGTPAQWQATFAALAARYPDLKFVIAEDRPSNVRQRHPVQPARPPRARQLQLGSHALVRHPPESPAVQHQRRLEPLRRDPGDDGAVLKDGRRLWPTLSSELVHLTLKRA